MSSQAAADNSETNQQGTSAAADILKSATDTLDLEAQGLSMLGEALKGEMAEPFTASVALIRAAKGRVIITGIGKSGHIGQKLAATLASTGTPSFSVHPSEASHGDLGMITVDDVIIACSWSGETVELTNIINYSARFKVPLIAITSRDDSALGKAATHVLKLPRAQEACPHGLAPTTSTTMQLAISDCLSIALLNSRGFTEQDFKVFHPGGQLGANLRFVEDVMHGEDALPLVQFDEMMSSALVTMTEKSFGCLGVVDDDGKLLGIITDGDLRRHMGEDLLKAKVGDLMTRDPKTVTPDTLASAALETINSSNITALFVVDDGKPVDIIHIHDLLRSGVA